MKFDYVKPTGIIRRMDELGRIVIPKEIQRQLGVKAGSPFEIFPTEGGLYLQPYVSEDLDPYKIPGLQTLK